MITATCTNTSCQSKAVDYNVLGEPKKVQCGACGEWCELTDLRPDPELLDPPDYQEVN
jgi:hypothetical protein